MSNRVKLRRIGVALGCWAIVAAAPVSVGALSLAEGEFVTYRLETQSVEGTCARITQESGSFLANVGVRGGKGYLFLPNAEPEVIALPVLMNGTLDDSGLSVAGDNEYLIRYLGRLKVDRKLTATFSDGDESIKVRLEIVASAEQTESEDPAAEKEIRSRYKLPCRSSVKIVGAKVQPVQRDIDLSVKLWTLLGKHNEALMMRDRPSALAALEEGLQAKGQHEVPFLWRKARTYYLLGEEQPLDADEKRLEYFQKGIDTARETMALDPSNGEAAFFLSANLGRWNTTKGFLTTVMGLEEFEAGCLKAIENKAANSLFGFRVLGDAHHALGIFYRLVPDSWLVEMLLGTRGDIEKSIEHHRQSLEIQPDRGDYIKELGVALMCYGQEEDDREILAEGISLLRRAAKTHVFVNDPALDHKHIAKLLANPEDACQYSRDHY